MPLCVSIRAAGNVNFLWRLIKYLSLKEMQTYHCDKEKGEAIAVNNCSSDIFCHCFGQN